MNLNQTEAVRAFAAFVAAKLHQSPSRLQDLADVWCEAQEFPPGRSHVELAAVVKAATCPP